MDDTAAFFLVAALILLVIIALVNAFLYERKMTRKQRAADVAFEEYAKKASHWTTSTDIRDSTKEGL